MTSPEKFESEQYENESDLQDIDLSELAASITEYNRQFNWGTLLADETIKDEAVKAEDGARDKSLKDKLSRKQVEKMHERALEKTGLSLESVRGIGTLVTSEKEIPSREMRINVADGRKFVAYLHALDGKSLTESQAKGLETVAGSLTVQLAEEYKLDNPGDERMIELFGSLEQIIDGYRRLDAESRHNIGKSVEELAIHIDIARQKYLKEYLRAKKEFLLAKPGEEHTFGPADWWKDSTPEAFREKYWRHAIQTTREIGKNPNAQSLYRDVRENLKASLRYTEKQLEHPPAHFKKSDLEQKLSTTREMYDMLEGM